MDDEFDEEFDPGCGPECDDCKAQLTFGRDDDGLVHGCAVEVCVYNDEEAPRHVTD